MSNTRRFPLTMHRARQLQRGEVMRPGVMLGSEALDPHVVHGADSACDDCGHVRCSCVKTAPVYGSLRDWYTRTMATTSPSARAFAARSRSRRLVAAIEPQGARDVRVGDVWAHDSGEQYRVLELAGAADGPMCKALRTGVHLRTSVMDTAIGWTLVSRAEPAQVDDGAVRVGDSFLFGIDDETYGVWTVQRIEPREAWGMGRWQSRQSHMLLSDLREGLAAGRYTRVTRGPAP